MEWETQLDEVGRAEYVWWLTPGLAACFCDQLNLGLASSGERAGLLEVGPMERLPAGVGIYKVSFLDHAKNPGYYQSRQFTSVLMQVPRYLVMMDQGPPAPVSPSGATFRDRPPLNAVLQTQEEWRRVVAAPSHQL